MKVQIDENNILPRQDELILYETIHATTLKETYSRLKSWFKNSSFIVGRGGHHVWVAVKETGKRIIMFYDFQDD